MPVRKVQENEALERGYFFLVGVLIMFIMFFPVAGGKELRMLCNGYIGFPERGNSQ